MDPDLIRHEVVKGLRSEVALLVSEVDRLTANLAQREAQVELVESLVEAVGQWYFDGNLDHLVAAAQMFVRAEEVRAAPGEPTDG